jgi:ABC-type dipeptide/oligopeptide/nickel transport system permease component
VFGAGVKILFVLILALTIASYSGWGWSGMWALLGTLLDPMVMLGLVPLAFLLGAIRAALLHIVRAYVRGSEHPSA